MFFPSLVIGKCISPSLTLEADCAQPAPATEEACFESFCNWTAGSPAVEVSKALLLKLKSDLWQVTLCFPKLIHSKSCLGRKLSNSVSQDEVMEWSDCNATLAVLMLLYAIVSKMVRVCDGFGVGESRENDMSQLARPHVALAPKYEKSFAPSLPYRH